MQVPGRYILSSLCDTLSIYVLVLCMAHQEPALHVGADLAGCLMRLCMEYMLAYLCLKFYDEPVRKYLARRFLSKKR